MTMRIDSTSPIASAQTNHHAKPNERVMLLGLDFGSTTCSALVASANIGIGVTGRVALNDIQTEYRCDPVLTPFLGQSIDVDKISILIQHWLASSKLNVDKIFSGGSMITGLAAQANNAGALSQLIATLVGESLIATADDPCLESWLAFMGSCAALSRYHADLPIVNFDIGGGTTNVAIGVTGNVLQTGCYFIGARHFQFVQNSYQITAISSYGATLLAELNINKSIGMTFNTDEITKIMAFYVTALEAIATGDADFFKSNVAQKHCQVAVLLQQNPLQPKIKNYITFSGGVGELIYKFLAGEAMPSTTFYGDFGIDLALAIVDSPILSADLSTCIPENKGRATLIGLTLHSTEISGNTTYLPQPDDLPLSNLPIIAKLTNDSTAEQWHQTFTLASKHLQGACIQVSANHTLAQIRILADKIKHALQTSEYKPSQPCIILVDINIGKVLGNYVSDWGQSHYHLMVIDEVALRDAHFVHIGKLYQGIIPVSFYGLN